MTEPLRLFWWNDQPNFGDAISQVVVAHASGREVVWAKPKACEIFAVGSILQIARRTHRVPREDGIQPWVWGSGCMGQLRKDFKGNVRFATVRGPVTASLMNVEAEGFGDPGLLIADAMDVVVPRGDHIGVVPHHSQLGTPEMAALFQRRPELRLIDVRRDWAEVCRDIAGCAHVVSSSLHGLIVADSFGVANTWLDPSGIHDSPQLKFYDYAAGVERALPPPVALADLEPMLANLPTGDLPYAHGLARSKDALMRLFPEDLKHTP